MRYHSQNLNESVDGKIIGSMFWKGRAWFYTKKEIHCEWYFGKHARMFHWGISFGDGDGEDGILLFAGIPWLFAFYFGVGGIWRTKEKEIGVAIHDNTIWFHTFSLRDEYHSKDPWWKKGLSWHFPWDWNWYSTEILEHDRPVIARAVHVDRSGHRLGDSFDRMRSADVVKKEVSKEYPYLYVRKNGTAQQRIATVCVERRTWRMKWWWLLPFRRQSTTIDVTFSDEVGEETGSWKGGCIGCGYEMQRWETPEECLRRMEKERKF